MSMRIVLATLLLLATTVAAADHPDWALAIHGGAGTMSRDAMSPEREQAYHAALKRALEAGGTVLADGGTSLDAVTTAITLLEDEPLFNAGKGAVFTSEGRNELDAAIMDGATLNAGAVAAVTRIKNPILLARAVMERSKHVLLIGAGAEAFAAEQGFSFVDPEYFFTQERWDSLQRAKGTNKGSESGNDSDPKPMGTVGAVALDTHGNLAAATSTGGMTNKRWGRVGDVPVIGAGTYAENATAAISATGHGEYFIRGVVAHEIAARMRLAGRTLEQASDEVVMQVLVERGGEGGVIAVDREGNISQPFNSSGMYRGRLTAGGEPYTAIFRD